MLLNADARLVTTRPTSDDCGHPIAWPAMGIVGVGIDLVSIPDFAEQVDQPGTAFSETSPRVSAEMLRTRVRRRHVTWRLVGRPRKR